MLFLIIFGDFDFDLAMASYHLSLLAGLFHNPKQHFPLKSFVNKD